MSKKMFLNNGSCKISVKDLFHIYYDAYSFRNRTKLFSNETVSFNNAINLCSCSPILLTKIKVFLRNCIIDLDVIRPNDQQHQNLYFVQLDGLSSYFINLFTNLSSCTLSLIL